MKKILTIIVITIIVTIIYSNVVLAYNLKLVLSADKTDVKVGDEITVTLTLSKGIQAADFILNYDSNLLQFKSASLGNNFYSTKEPGKIICSWFDTNDKDIFTFTFSAINSGTAKFSTTTENFYDGNLQSASSYNEGTLNVTLLSSNSSINQSTILSNSSNNQQQLLQQIDTSTTVKESKNTTANTQLPKTRI